MSARRRARCWWGDRGIVELAHSRLQPRSSTLRGRQSSRGGGRRRPREILIVAEQNLVANAVDEDAGLSDAQRFRLKDGPSVASKKLRLMSVQLEIARVVGEGVELDAVALVLQIVAVVQRADIEGAPVGAATDW